MLKANLSYILFIIYLFCFHTNNAQEIDKKTKYVNIPEMKTPSDSIPKDSVTIKKPREVLEFPVTHNAEDYIIQNAKKQTVTLYNKAHIIYNDVDLTAGKIIVDYKNSRVFASGIKEKDSLGNEIYTQRPVFKQGSQESEQDSIIFNFKTEKALVYGVNTKEGEMLVYGEKTKRVNDSTIYMRNIRFTTSNKKNPDYYIATDKAKLVPGKKIIVGASQMVIADVPTPLYLPFAYFPLAKKRTSGFLVPSWGEDNTGFFLQNGGYYFVVNDYLDLELTGDIYSNGSWGVNSASNYYVRYKYSGNFRLSYQNQINSIRGFNDYSKRTNFQISWSHRQDPKSNPNSTFSAQVRAGTSTFYQESFNERDINNTLQNVMSSSISYQKKFVGTPFNMNVTLNHSQNSQTEQITMTLPSIGVNMQTQYPFQGKSGIKKGALQNIGVSYNMNGQYRINTTDDEFFTQKMWNEAKSGIQHNVSTNTKITVFKHFNLSPSLSYEDTWFFKRINKKYDPTAYNTSTQTYGSAVNDTISGFKRLYNYSGGVSLSTPNIYGTFKFKGKRLKAIRHTIQPSVNWNYKPDLGSQYLQNVQNSYDPSDILEYNPYTISAYGAPSSSKSSSLGINIRNVLEAKVAADEEKGEEEDKKITLLNNLNFSTSYNLFADEFKWNNIRMSAGTSIFNNRLTLNLNGDFDPYKKNNDGKRVEEFNLRLNNLNLSANFSLSNKDFQKGKTKEKKKNEDPNNSPDVYTAKTGKRSNEFAHQLNNNEKQKTKRITQLYRASIPWNVNFSYATGYRNDGYKTDEIQRHTLGFSGNLELSPKWGLGFRSGYDIKEGAFTPTNLNFSRDLDSFRFNFNWTPFGYRKSYYFFIGIKSSMLSDLKWDKNRPPDKNLY